MLKIDKNKKNNNSKKSKLKSYSEDPFHNNQSQSDLIDELKNLGTSEIITLIDNSRQNHSFILHLFMKTLNQNDQFSFLTILSKITEIKQDENNAKVQFKILDSIFDDKHIPEFGYNYSEMFMKKLQETTIKFKGQKRSKDDENSFRDFIKLLNRSNYKNQYSQLLIQIQSETIQKRKVIGQKPEFNKFDNDKKQIKEIEILPTQDEFHFRRSKRNPYLPLFDKSNVIEDLDDSELIIDRNQRLLREELIDEMIEKESDRRKPILDLSFKSFLTDNKRMNIQYVFSFPDAFKKQKGNAKFKQWEKRFLQDSLVILIQEQVVILCTVKDRDMKKLTSDKPEIGLFPVSKEQAKLLNIVISFSDQKAKMKMVSDSYFSFKPILNRLKLIDKVPFYDHIFKNNKPKESKIFNSNQLTFSSIFTLRGYIIIPKYHESWNQFQVYNNQQESVIINQFKTNTTLDNGQINSIISFFKDPLVLVQGPPGTGKTFIGALMVEIIIKNTNLKVLTVTFTNHALDQFSLFLISRGLTDFVRLGGMSKNEKLQEQVAAPVYDQIPIEERVKFAKNKEIIIEIFKHFKKDKDLLNQLANDMFETQRQNYNLKITLEQFIQNIDTLLNTYEYLQCFYQFKDYLNSLDSQYDCQETKEALSQHKFKQSLEHKRIIAATTVGCAKFNSIISDCKPDILIVEEAGEVLESHLITSLFPSLKKVILIGDHKQLRPKLNCWKLKSESQAGFNFNVSILEQAVNLNIIHSTLTMQHRMHPEISKQINTLIYDGKVSDSPNLLKVENRPMVLGTNSRVLFLNHQNKENESDENDATKLNKFSSTQAIKLAEQFINQRYSPSSITILTPYLGQLFKILKNKSNVINTLLDDRDLTEMITLNDDEDETDLKLDMQKKKELPNLRAATIDNQQGEESDIIILDLVRCNKQGQIGFLKEFQRVNVALSRAKIGMYIIGSESTLTQGEGIDGCWTKFFKMMKEDDKVHDQFSAVCQKHQTLTKITNLKDFDLVSNGGCELICDNRKKCGHVCKNRCHAWDCENQNNCFEPCQRVAVGCNSEEKHKCKAKCNMQCLKCKVKVNIQLKDCNHTKKVECVLSKSEDHYCPIVIDQSCIRCNGKNRAECGRVKQGNLRCDFLCNQKLDCGHKCQNKCGHEDKHICLDKCNKPRSDCIHNCLLRCHVGKDCPPCSYDVGSCNHNDGKQKCSEAAKLCQQKCSNQCDHQKKRCANKCQEECSFSCEEICEETHYECNHSCPFKCMMNCPKVCLICNNQFNQINKEELIGYILNKRSLIYLECNHVQTIDEWREEKIIESDDEQIKCKQCDKEVRNTFDKEYDLRSNSLHNVTIYKKSIQQQLGVKIEYSIENQNDLIHYVNSTEENENKNFDNLLKLMNIQENKKIQKEIQKNLKENIQDQRLIDFILNFSPINGFGKYQNSLNKYILQQNQEIIDIIYKKVLKRLFFDYISNKSFVLKYKNEDNENLNIDSIKNKISQTQNIQKDRIKTLIDGKQYSQDTIPYKNLMNVKRFEFRELDIMHIQDSKINFINYQTENLIIIKNKTETNQIKIQVREVISEKFKELNFQINNLSGDNLLKIQLFDYKDKKLQTVTTISKLKDYDIIEFQFIINVPKPQIQIFQNKISQIICYSDKIMNNSLIIDISGDCEILTSLKKFDAIKYFD